MPFSDLQDKLNEIKFEEGFEAGRCLANRQLWFLQNTRIGKMKFKKYKDQYDLLFNYGNHKTP